MNKVSFRNALVLWGILFFSLLLSGTTRAGFDRDPIEETQTKAVPVTQELLTREGEPGPASPTYKVSDTARFLVKKPYEEVEESILDDLSGEEEGAVSEEDWFSWNEEEDGSILPEPVDNK